MDEDAMSKSFTFAALVGAAAALTCGVTNAEPLFAFLTPPTQTQIAPQAVEPAPAEDRDDTQVSSPVATANRQLQ